jgi:hypothetical protein
MRAAHALTYKGDKVLGNLPLAIIGVVFVAASQTTGWHQQLLAFAMLAIAVGAIRSKKVTLKDRNSLKGLVSIVVVLAAFLLGISFLFGEVTLPVLGIRMNADASLIAGALALLVSGLTMGGK